jgi:hypothetical protein
MKYLFEIVMPITSILPETNMSLERDRHVHVYNIK